MAGATKIFASVFTGAGASNESDYESEHPGSGRSSGIVLTDRYGNPADDDDADEYQTVSLDEVELLEDIPLVETQRRRRVVRGRSVRRPSSRRAARHIETHPGHAPGAGTPLDTIDAPSTEQVAARLGFLVLLTGLLVTVSYLTQ